MKTWSQWVQEHRDYLSAETFPEGVLDVDMAQAMLAPYMQGKHDKVDPKGFHCAAQLADFLTKNVCAFVVHAIITTISRDSYLVNFRNV